MNHDPSDRPDPSDPSISSDLLPPVQPPEARFLMQLFITPLLIVSIIIGVFFLVTWLARPDDRPELIVARIERMDHRSWQQALALANQLRDGSNNDLRANRELAQRLSDLLAGQLLLKSPSQDRVRLQIYLCRALGEFEVDTGLPVLVMAAGAEPAWRNPLVRRSAIQSIGTLSERLGNESNEMPSDVRSVLFAAIARPPAAASTDDPLESSRLRSTATYVLGLFSAPEARQKLVALLNDAEPDIRFNAATGLARQGDLKAVPTLQQMLRWPERDSSPDETAESAVEARQKRDLVVSAALRAIVTLAERQPDFDLATFREPIEAILRDATIAQTAQEEARDVLRLLDAEKTRRRDRDGVS